MFFVKADSFQSFRARIVTNRSEFSYSLLLLIIVNDNELRAFIIIRCTEGVQCFALLFGPPGHAREINASPVSIYERKAIDHRATVTRSRDDGTQRILFR